MEDQVMGLASLSFSVMIIAAVLSCAGMVAVSLIRLPFRLLATFGLTAATFAMAVLTTLFFVGICYASQWSFLSSLMCNDNAPLSLRCGVSLVINFPWGLVVGIAWGVFIMRALHTLWNPHDAADRQGSQA